MYTEETVKQHQFGLNISIYIFSSKNKVSTFVSWSFGRWTNTKPNWKTSKTKNIVEPQVFSPKKSEKNRNVGMGDWTLSFRRMDRVFFVLGKKTCTNSIRCTKNIRDIVSDVFFFTFCGSMTNFEGKDVCNLFQP